MALDGLHQTKRGNEAFGFRDWKTTLILALAFVGVLCIAHLGINIAPKMQQFHSQPDWKLLYEAAVLEFDLAKLPDRIKAARNAIFDRIEESLTNPFPGEHRAMDDALRHLRRLQRWTQCRELPPEP